MKENGIVYLNEKEAKRILKDMDTVKMYEDIFVKESWNIVDRIYDKYSNKFANPLIKYFGESYVVDLEHLIYEDEFETSLYGYDNAEDAIRDNLENWPKYLILAGLSHWIYTKMEKIEDGISKARK